MDEPTTKGSLPDDSGPEAGRRRLLKALTVSAGAAAAAAVLPKDWVKPVVDAVDVPLHAQGTATLTISDLVITPPGGVAETATMGNHTVQFQYRDTLGMFCPSATHLWAAIRDCQADLITLYPWVALSAIGMPVGNPTGGSFLFGFQLPLSCWTALLSTLLVQLSGPGPGGTSRLSNQLSGTIPIPRD